MSAGEKFKSLSWDELSFQRKRHVLYHFLKNTRIAFWRVTSKDLQHYYIKLQTTEDTIDQYRDEIYKIYCLKLSQKGYADTDFKLAKAKALLKIKE